MKRVCYTNYTDLDKFESLNSIALKPKLKTYKNL